MTTQPLTGDATAVLPQVPAAPPRPVRGPIPVPPEFGPRQRQATPVPARVVLHPAQWQEHLDAMEALGRVVKALLALLAVVLILLGYVTLEAAQMVSAIHSLDTVRAGIGI